MLSFFATAELHDCIAVTIALYLEITCGFVDVPAAFADMINLEILNFFNNNIEVR